MPKNSSQSRPVLAPTPAPASAPASAPALAAAAALECWLTNLGVARRYSSHTLAAYRRDVAAWLAWLHARAGRWDMPAPAELRGWLAERHRRGAAPRSLRRALAAVRGFYGYRMQQGALAANPAADLRAPKVAPRLPAVLDADQVCGLLDRPADDALECRDRALLELLYSSGLRLSELTQADLTDLDLHTGELRVLGKGARERIVPVGRKARDALAVWLALRAQWADPDMPALFITARGRRLTPRGVQQRVHRAGLRAGVDLRLHPHLLRHCCASHMLESSGDLRAVQELLGHRDIRSTEIYTHLDFQHLAAVYDRAHPRARRRS